ncbi:MAG TPA: hypothetical protein VGB05_00230 [Pyrinomonadaceae bacterium]
MIIDGFSTYPAYLRRLEACDTIILVRSRHPAALPVDGAAKLFERLSPARRFPGAETFNSPQRQDPEIHMVNASKLHARKPEDDQAIRPGEKRFPSPLAERGRGMLRRAFAMTTRPGAAAIRSRPSYETFAFPRT